MEARVFPFCFREHLRHLGQEPTGSTRRLSSAQHSLLRAALGDYLRCGGFAEAYGLGERERFELLSGYVDSVILRDIIERHGVGQPVALRWLVRQLLGNAAGLFSINKFHGDLVSQGFHVGKDSVHEWLGYLEDSFLVRTSWVAGGSERRRMVNPRKSYPIDMGIIPVFDRAGRANTGHALETCVRLELERRGAQVSYVAQDDGTEVDILARMPGGQEEVVQVCVALDDPSVAAREYRAMAGAARQFPGAGRTLVVLDRSIHGKAHAGIRVVQAHEWLLDDGRQGGAKG
jgi:predicted AAA+ superfamily ATPase